MFYQVVIAVGLTACLLNLFLNLISLKTPRRKAVIPGPAPRVSIMVPARNEATNIRACLESLQKQDYPDFEILVLDDNSTDETTAIVTGMAAADPRIRLFTGKPLPEGWAGKPYACHQLSEQAGGEWYLFVDADTIHAPHMLRSTLSLAMENNAALLSGFPRQLADSMPQKVAIPVLYFIILSWLPLWWIHRSSVPRPSLAIGQFLLFPRDAYLKMGGHTAVKSRILEDVWLGMEITRRGGRHLAVNLSPAVSCLMYRNIADMWEGVLKWCYSVAYLSPLALVAMIIVGYFLFLAPFYWLWNEFVMLTDPSPWRWYVVFQIGVILFMRIIADARFRESAVSAVFHPVGFGFVIAAAVVSSFRRVVGAGVRWKNREYGKESIVK